MHGVPAPQLFQQHAVPAPQQPPKGAGKAAGKGTGGKGAWGKGTNALGEPTLNGYTEAAWTTFYQAQSPGWWRHWAAEAAHHFVGRNGETYTEDEWVTYNAQFSAASWAAYFVRGVYI